ncbi:hypothetical protein HZ326_26724 [Fusarium oxysporum f. sp. albedinis]|nr:hypothetical protein HZ326_26724 [Fusarium oxysporum f. sp. albedinis]
MNSSILSLVICNSTSHIVANCETSNIPSLCPPFRAVYGVTYPIILHKIRWAGKEIQGCQAPKPLLVKSQFGL